jgi:hypothetical protein
VHDDVHDDVHDGDDDVHDDVHDGDDGADANFCGYETEYISLERRDRRFRI